MPYFNTLEDAVGPATASRAIFFIYDIFGYWPQTIQGADRLSASVDALVFIPDLREDQHCLTKWLAIEDPAMKAKKEEFMRFALQQEKFVAKLSDFVKAAKVEYPSLMSLGAFGLCWGAKVSCQTSLQL